VLYAVGASVVVRFGFGVGTLDTAFNGTGRLTLQNASLLQQIMPQASNGKLLVAGAAVGGLFLGRVTTAGVVDVTFGTSGQVVHTANGDGKIVQQADGKIVQVGKTSIGGATHCVAVRYSADGMLDPTFGQGGVATIAVDGCRGDDVGLQADGKILVTGPKTVRLWP